MLLLLPWLVGAGRSDDDVWEQGFRCEEAAAHATDCCPGLRVGELLCANETRGCMAFDDQGCAPDPVLSIAESVCVRDASCERLRARGVCDALRALEGVSSCARRPGGSVCR